MYRQAWDATKYSPSTVAQELSLHRIGHLTMYYQSPISGNRPSRRGVPSARGVRGIVPRITHLVSTRKYEFAKTRACNFYTELLDVRNPIDCKAAQIKCPARAVAPSDLADAICRVSQGFGLPQDGHLVHALFQGQAMYYNGGATGKLKVTAISDTENDWNIGDSKLPVICEGDSNAGKDNAKAIVQGWIKVLDELRLPATKVYKQGNLTISGLLRTMASTGGGLHARVNTRTRA